MDERRAKLPDGRSHVGASMPDRRSGKARWRRFWVGALCSMTALASALTSAPAAAQAYPNRPIRLIHPFSTGGSADLLARILNQKLTEVLGQPVVVDNRPGAGGNIGMEAAAKAAPDGYTLVVAYNGTMAINPALYPSLPFDPVKDFAPISMLASSQLALVIHPSVPASNVQELIALAKGRATPLSYGSGGAGTGPHLAAELFKTLAGVEMLHVPYKGSGPAMVDLLGGHVQVGFLPVITAVPHVKSGKLRVLGVTGAGQLAAVPDWAPLARSLPGYGYTSWFGLVAPAKTPAEIVDRLNRAVLQAVKTPDVAERFSGEGLELITSTPAEFGSFIGAELRKWDKVVKDARIKLN